MPIPDLRSIARQSPHTVESASKTNDDRQREEGERRQRRSFGLKGELRADTGPRRPKHSHDKKRSEIATSASQASIVVESPDISLPANAVTCSTQMISTSVISTTTVFTTIPAPYQPFPISVWPMDARASAHDRAANIAARDSIVSNTTIELAPACPQDNNTIYRYAGDSYQIRCNADNEEPSLGTVQIDSGGYSSCFSSCSNTTSCAGFTYVGLDSGSCYLKSDLPDSLYVAKNGSNYISCSKVNSSGVSSVSSGTTANDGPTSSGEPSSRSSQSSSPSQSGTNTGAIVGGTISGLALVLLLLVLLLVLYKRHRSRDDQEETTRSRARSLTALGGLVLPPQEDEVRPSLPLHSSHASTGNDIFSPFGGAYFLHAPLPPPPVELDSYMQPAKHHARQRSTYSAQELESNEKR